MLWRSILDSLDFLDALEPIKIQNLQSIQNFQNTTPLVFLEHKLLSIKALAIFPHLNR